MRGGLGFEDFCLWTGPGVHYTVMKIFLSIGQLIAGEAENAETPM